MLWPLVEVTPRVTHLQGWAGVALGVSILAIGLTPVVPEILGGVLVLVAMVGYLAGAVLFVYSTYLSRRVAR
jgi:energy-converting hydrogenase Eha subunit A